MIEAAVPSNDAAMFLGGYDDPQTIYLLKVLVSTGERFIVSVPAEQMDVLRRVLFRGAANPEGCSPQIVSLIDRLEHGTSLDSLIWRPREGEANDSQFIYHMKVVGSTGERHVLSAPIQQLEGFKNVLFRGAANMDACSPQIVSLVDRLQHGVDLHSLIWCPQEEKV